MISTINHPSQRTRLQPLIMTLLMLLLTAAAAITPNTHETLQEIESAAITSILQDLPSLRGSFESSQLKLIREKLRSLKEGSIKEISASNSLRRLNGELPPNNPSWQSQWMSLSDDELSILSHDSSFLTNRQQYILNAAYLSRRRTSVTIPAIFTGALLRGGQQQQQQQDRDLASWTTHGDVSEVPGTIVDGEVVFNKPESQESVEKENTEFLLMGYDTTTKQEDDEEYIQDLYTRLHDAMEVTKRLDQNYAHYDTNSQWTYSNPPPETNTHPGVDEMVQHAALDSDRQRLLTGSYAVWQWYDRNNLASPGNMDFKKLSRVNYAFFQTDGDGFIFGTDSWADPNVLFGPYDFGVNNEKLPPECKGGRGRDDGKPKNATVDEFAIYNQQPTGNVGAQQQQQQQEPQGGGGKGNANNGNKQQQQGGNANNSNRRTQNTQNTNTGGGKNTNSFQYPDFTKDPPCKSFEQCHRNFPNSKTCNVHKHQEGLIHIAHTDGAQVYPSIGGWTLSNSFPKVAADPKKRLRFARECVGLIADYGFDGIDIDWEYPGYEPHGGSAEDRKNFNELLLAIRVALNEYQEQTGDAPIGGGAFGLTAALPCGPANINFLDVSFLSEVLNGMNLMSFDFHNEQEPITGVASPLYDQGWGEKGLSVDGCVKNYYKAGAGNVASKISIGVPFYGKTYSYANDLNAPHSNTNGLFGGKVDQANWPQDLGTPVFYNMHDTMIKGSMVCKRHEPTKSAYAYFKDGSGLVTYDDPQAVCNKAEYVNQNLLGGLFIWELSGDLLDTLSTPLLDAINRKLEEINFDCANLMMEEDCSLVELPPPAAKGSAQVEATEGMTNITEAILEHLQKAEAGELSSAGRGYGAFTRAAFMMREYDGSLFPSYTYRFDHFVDALATMAVTGVDGDTFYLGGADDAKTSRLLQGLNFTKKSTSLVYGLVNIALFMAQAMTESIIHDTCDELNIQPLPNSTEDGIGFDDGHDHFRFPLSNACGQNGRSYQDEQCKRTEDKMYDCAAQLNSEEVVSMEVTAFSQSRWPGSPGPLYCGPKTVYGDTGFWNAAVGKENSSIPLANDDGRTDVEGCCFWGRGCLLSVKGTCLLGKLNYHLGANKAKRDGEAKAMFPDVDFCLDPSQICAGVHSTKLRWIIGLYHWIENVQSYNEDGFNFMEELNAYVGDNLDDENFFLMVTRIHLFGCHLSSCSDAIPDMDDRIRNFEKVLSALNLQFTSFAKAEPPFKTFPGQVPPTQPPVVDAATSQPTGSPITTIENVEAQVRMYLTGVPPDKNMSSSELKLFDNLMLELLVPRLQTADVDVKAVKTVQQNPDTDFVADSNFNTDIKEDKAVLELVLNITLSYYPPEPAGWREWSIYLKAWIESFGSTMVDIFTSPKNPQHPETNSKFWDDLSDVSAANVPPGGIRPKEIPTPPPTYIVIPEQTAANKAILGMGIGVGSIAFFIFLFFGCYIYRKFKQEKSRAKKKGFIDDDDISYGFSSKAPSYDRRSRPSRYSSRASGSRGNEYNRRVFDKLLDGIQEGSSESDSSSDSSSSDSSSDSSSESSDSSSSSSDSEEPVMKRNSPLNAYPQAQASHASISMASKSEASASIVSGYESKSHSDTKSFASDYESQSHSESFVSDYESRGAAESMSKSQATESMATDPGAEDYLEIVRRASANDPTLRIISLDNQRTIGHNDDGERLWSALVNNQYVECLSIRSSNVSDAQVSALSVALMDNRSVSRLWLENNAISSEGAEYLISALEENGHISEVRLDGNPKIDPALLDDINSILGASVATDDEDNLGFVVDQIINNDPSLRELNLSGMNIGARSDALFDALAGNIYVRALDLSCNEIDDDCVSSLSIALMENSSIVSINLSDNFVTSEGAEYLIGLLDTNTIIKSIDLSDNDIGLTVLKDIEDILAKRQVQSSSSVASSLAEEGPLAGVVQSLQSNDPSMVELCLDNVDLSDCPEAEGMIDALVGNTTVKRLSLANTCFDDGLAASLSLSLVDNSTITHIILNNNHITDEGCDYLLGTLDSNTTLLQLDLEENYIDEKLLDEIDAILSERQSSACAGRSSRASESVGGYSTTGSYSSASASISMASRVSSVASSFMSRRSSSKQRDKKASAKIAGKEIV